jgi:hypothetical protein
MLCRSVGKRNILLVALLLMLLIFTLRWICPGSYAQQQERPILTVACKPGGSVIVESYAINGGRPYTVAPGQEQSWEVPYGVSVRLTATDFASGLWFKGWDGPYWHWRAGGPGTNVNPVTIRINQTARVAGVFRDTNTLNDVVVTVQTPRNATYNQKSIPVTFTVANPVPDSTYYRIRVYNVRFFLNGQPFYGAETSSTKLSSGDIYRYNSSLSVLAEGEHSFYVVACATFELIREPLIGPGSHAPGSGVSDMGYFFVDTTSPRVSVLSPEAKAYGASDVRLSFGVNEDASRMIYSLDREDNVIISGNTTLSGLTIGDHNVTVYAWDEAGNIGASETVTFTVAKESFPTTFVGVAIIASVALVSFGLVAYFIKRNRRGSK